jgi:hypothetical protein
MKDQQPLPIRFIDEPIEVMHSQAPLLEKTPGCPDQFKWQGETFEIVELMAEWQDFKRRGRMARNMAPPHKSRAERIGSWGVGRFFFRVRVSSGQIFELYYDRAPVDVDDRKGRWVLFAERFE